MVLLIGNYAPDEQQSMLRFGRMMLDGLAVAGVRAELLAPHPFFGRFRAGGRFVAKWLGYLDKFLVFPLQLRVRARAATVVHICDHSNSMYARWCRPLPVVVTCHDLLAVRGALGEETNSPASVTGRFLQSWIRAGLSRASIIACVSAATRDDVLRLVRKTPPLEVVTSGLNYPYAKLSADEVAGRLRSIPQLSPGRPFVLHVGSSVPRKNRDGVLRIFALCREQWDGQLVFAGDPLTPELHSLAVRLGVRDRVIEVPFPDCTVLEALYNRATALLYPSRFEGFGWPIAEAQACGCPVICSNTGPMPEVAGEAGLLHPLEDEDAFARDVLRLADPSQRAIWSEKSVRSAERFSTERMIARYVELYRRAGADVAVATKEAAQTAR